MNNYEKLELLKKEIESYKLELSQYNDKIHSNKIISKLDNILGKVK